MDASTVFRIAGDYRKQPKGISTINYFQENLPISDIEKIEYYLEAIRYVQSYRFDSVKPLMKWKGINRKLFFAELGTFLKNEKILGSKLYGIAASFLIEAGGEKVFENLKEEDLRKYFKGEITIEKLYKGNKDAFDFTGASGEGYSLEKINLIYTTKVESVNDIYEGLEIEDEEDLEYVEKINAIPELKKARIAKCTFIVYVYQKSKFMTEEAEETRLKLEERITINEE